MISSSAYIYYGLPIPKACRPNITDVDGFEHRLIALYAEKRGLNSKTAKWQTVVDCFNASGIKILESGCLDYDKVELHLAIPASIVETDDSKTKRVDRTIEGRNAWNRTLMDFCELMGIPYTDMDFDYYLITNCAR